MNESLRIDNNTPRAKALDVPVFDPTFMTTRGLINYYKAKKIELDQLVATEFPDQDRLQLLDRLCETISADLERRLLGMPTDPDGL